MLLSQMGAVHKVLMQSMRNFAQVQGELSRVTRDLAQKSNPYIINKLPSVIKSLALLQDSTASNVNRLARTYCMQLEASDHHRRSNEPSTTVHVAPGGQAIVGNVTHAPPQTAPNNPTAGPRVLTDHQHSAMPIIGVTGPSGSTQFVAGKKAMTSNHPRNTNLMLSSPRCGARTRSGKPCMSPAVSGKKRCRMHGGAEGSGAPLGNRNAQKHGLYTGKSIEERRQLRDLLRQSRD